MPSPLCYVVTLIMLSTVSGVLGIQPYLPFDEHRLYLANQEKSCTNENTGHPDGTSIEDMTSTSSLSSPKTQGDKLSAQVGVRLTRALIRLLRKLYVSSTDGSRTRDGILWCLQQSFRSLSALLCGARHELEHRCAGYIRQFSSTGLLW